MTLSCKCGALVERQRKRAVVTCDNCAKLRSVAVKARWSENNREAKNRQSRGYYARCRERAIAHYSNGKNECCCCYEKEFGFLTIDHVDNDGAEHRRKNPSAINLAPWLVSHGLPAGYQVMCFNCNIAKGIYGECPHRRVVEQVA